MRSALAVWSLSVVGMFAGCDSQQPPKTNPTVVTVAPPQEPPVVDPAKPAMDDSEEQEKTQATDRSTSDESTVIPIDADGLQAAVDKHAGKVVLVDCWATWCIQCIKDFPHTVEMSRKYADQGLVVMSLSFDDLSDEERLVKVREFLRKQEAKFENYISKLDLEKEGAEAFQIEDGALPHYKLYGRDGKLLKALTNADPDMPLSHADLEAVVEEALK